MASWRTATVLLVAVAAGGCGAPTTRDGPDAVPDQTAVPATSDAAEQDEPVQSAEEALAQDMKLADQQSGESVEHLRSALEFRDAFDAYVLELSDRYGDQISAAYAERSPATRGHIRFVAEIPPEVVAEVQKSGWDVELSGGTGISRDDHSRRVQAAAQALADAGYDNYVIGYSVTLDVIELAFRVPENSPRPNRVDVVHVIREAVADQALTGRAAQVLDRDIVVLIEVGEGPIVLIDR